MDLDHLLKKLEKLKLFCEATQPKDIINVQMRSYQLDGLGFLHSHVNAGVSALLGDEMGLGR